MHSITTTTFPHPDMSSFEFYSLPTELKRVIFDINKAKYKYDNFVKSFNKRVDDEAARWSSYGLRGENPMEFDGYSMWISVFLDKDHYEIMEGELEGIIWARGARQYYIGDEVRANSSNMDMIPYDPAFEFGRM
jgi:hypothetical protein